jgi:ADP-dependent NAD(P)H-hydrate dehydratase / NAD(P)H-hydrate epimerase
MRVLNATQMREADRRTIVEIGIPSLVLMENAGRQVVAALEAHFDGVDDLRVAVLSGRGNNGGDGFVAARTLLNRGVDVAVFVIGSLDDIKGDARVNLEVLGRLGLSVVEIANEQEWELHSSEIGSCDVIVDAIFGTGLRTPIAGVLETIVADINEMGIPVVSIDLPSGMSADTHRLIGDCLQATVTVTLAAPKLPLVLPPAAARAGELVIADIGIPPEVIDEVDGPQIHLVMPEPLREYVRPRADDAHKGDFGHVLVIAGSRGKSGAAHLAAMGALRSGAGLVTVATPASCQGVVAALAPEYMTEALDETPAGQIDPRCLDRVLAMQRDLIAVGPGIGTDPETRQFVWALLERTAIPLILDADALNAFEDDPGRLLAREGQTVIVTPHPGEMARLLGMPTSDIQANRIESAVNFATTHRLYVVLKGSRTIVATPDGTAYVNLTGNPGMATGGTGDVLTGVIAGWLAQLMDAEVACQLGVYLHGLAGDLAEADVGEVAMTAGDVLDHLPDAVLELSANRRRQAGREAEADRREP